MPESVQERVLIRCKISPGLFADERGVRIELPNGEEALALVHKSQVKVERDPASGEEVDGAVWASVVRDAGGNVVIDLPQETFSGGTRVTVPKTLMRKAA